MLLSDGEEDAESLGRIESSNIYRSIINSTSLIVGEFDLYTATSGFQASIFEVQQNLIDPLKSRLMWSVSELETDSMWWFSFGAAETRMANIEFKHEMFMTFGLNEFQFYHRHN